MEEVKQCEIEILTLKAIQRLILLTILTTSLWIDLPTLPENYLIYFYEANCHKSCKLIERRNVIELFAMLPLQFPVFSLHIVELNFTEFKQSKLLIDEDRQKDKCNISFILV